MECRIYIKNSCALNSFVYSSSQNNGRGAPRHLPRIRQLHFIIICGFSVGSVSAERDARSARIGLWSHPNPTAPWEFRRRRGNSDDTGFHPNTNRRNSSQRRSPNHNPKSFITVTSNRRFSINPTASITTAKTARKNSTARNKRRRMDTGRVVSVLHKHETACMFSVC